MFVPYMRHLLSRDFSPCWPHNALHEVQADQELHEAVLSCANDRCKKQETNDKVLVINCRVFNVVETNALAVLFTLNTHQWLVVASSLLAASTHGVGEVTETGKLDVVIWTEEVDVCLWHKCIAEVVGVGRVGLAVSWLVTTVGKIVHRHPIVAADGRTGVVGVEEVGRHASGGYAWVSTRKSLEDLETVDRKSILIVAWNTNKY